MEQKISRNLHNARVAAGETQREVAGAVHVVHNAISQYETGERSPDLQLTASLAAHFRIPVDQLISGQISGEKVSLSMDWEGVIRLFDLMIPEAFSEKAMKNEYFTDGYQKLQLLWNMVKNPRQPFLESVMESAEVCFALALQQEPEQPEAAANLIRLHVFRYFLLGDEEDLRVGKALLDGEGRKPDFQKNLLRKKPGAVPNSRQRDYVRATQPRVMELLRILRRSPEYRDLAEHYLAMRYLLAMVENDSSEDSNRDFGTELVMDYAALGNPYARALMAYMEDFTICEAPE